MEYMDGRLKCALNKAARKENSKKIMRKMELPRGRYNGPKEQALYPWLLLPRCYFSDNTSCPQRYSKGGSRK